MFYKLASAVLALALISFLVLGTSTSYAETVTVIGADGAPGMRSSATWRQHVAQHGPKAGICRCLAAHRITSPAQSRAM
jgi:hypothetical protein